MLSSALRALAVAAFAAAPVAALETAPVVPGAPGISTGDANAVGPGISGENTGGNVKIDNGKLVNNPPFIVPTAPDASGKALAPPVAPPDPSAAAVAKAKALVDELKAKADKLINDANANAQATIDEAKQKAADAQGNAQAESDAAKARAAQASAQAQASAD